MSVAPALGSDLNPRPDGYLRVHGGRRLISRESPPAGNHAALLFIDVEDAVEAEDVIAALQEAPPRLAHTRYILVRMPDVIAGTGIDVAEMQTSLAQGWAHTLLERRLAISPSSVHLGTVQFVVGNAPQVHWATGTGARDLTDGALLQRALRAELLTLLEFGNAIWRPDSYHYQLPSGQHAASFVRLGDAFRSPRDVHAIATWLTPRLHDRQAIVADSASLVPLITELNAMVRRQGWTPGRVEMLDEYPRTQLDINRVIRPLRDQPGGVLALMSVNSSGRYQGMFMSTLASSFEPPDWSMVVLVNKTDDTHEPEYLATPDDFKETPVSTWLGLADKAGKSVTEATCGWCKDNRKAQLVRIDPRTFEALALPDVNLLMPSVPAALASTAFWDLCNDADALGVRAKPAEGPSIVSRPKSGLMSLYIDFDRLLESPTFETAVARRVETLLKSPNGLDYSDCTAVIVSSYEAAKPGFISQFDALRAVLGLEGAQLVEADPNSNCLPIELKDHKAALIFALGSVTSWNMRQLLTRVQEAWRPLADRTMYGLVLHARPQTRREWRNLSNSFEGRLDALWLTFLPWRDPLAEESVALKELPTDDLSTEARAFYEARTEVLSARPPEWIARIDEHDGTPVGEQGIDPRAVLWGLPPYGGSEKLRRQSLYGYEARALTAYAAIGAAVHEQRQRDTDYDPRRRMFDLPSISRSYYDAIIVAGILRWAEPQETWWGNSETEAKNAVGELLARTAEPNELKILIPELLYAASQGKLPPLAAEHVRAEAERLVGRWEADHRGPTELGLAMLKNASAAT